VGSAPEELATLLSPYVCGTAADSRGASL